MLDQNLLDKQYILESLIDLFEKHSTNCGILSNTSSSATNLSRSSSQSQSQSSNVNSTVAICNPNQVNLPGAYSCNFEANCIKLILNTSKHSTLLTSNTVKTNYFEKVI